MDGTLLDEVRRKLCREIDIEAEGVDRFNVYTPFMFDDGDHFVSILKRHEDEWVITDEGHTLMHLSYGGPDVTADARGKILEEVLREHSVSNDAGILSVRVGRDAIGDGLFSYLQAISQVANLSRMTRSHVASAFLGDFRELMESLLPPQGRTFNWHDPQRDPDGNYPVDCHYQPNGKAWLMFGVNSTGKCQNATITCQWFERHGIEFDSVAFYEDQTAVSRRAVAQLSDIVGKQFASLGDRERISTYVRRQVLAQ